MCAFSFILLCAQGPLWIRVCAEFYKSSGLLGEALMMESIFLWGCWFTGESPSQQGPSGRKALGDVVDLVQAPAKTRMS